MLRQQDDLGSAFSRWDIASRASIVAAVSGGSDSTALLLLLKDYLTRAAPQTTLVAVIVDHALRPGSAEEAVEVGRLCAKLEIAHHIVTWSGSKPATGLLAAAREARHDLLAAAARAVGSDMVLTGHTANDQAETVLMRAERERGRGMAGIAPATLFDGRVWFVRPLLAIRRQALRHFLQLREIGWIEDPSNVNERFERPRVRKSLAQADVEAALHTAAAGASIRVSLGRSAAKLIDAHASMAAAGLIRLERDFFRSDCLDASVYALRILLAVAGGTKHLPDQARVAALHARLATEGRLRAVLSRTLVDSRKDAVFMLRERRNLPGPDATTSAGIWDERYRIPALPEFVRLATGEQGHPTTAYNPGGAPESLVRLAASVQPEPVPGLTAVPILSPWSRYLPSFDIAPARSAARLVGAPEIPDAPFLGHIEREA